MNFYDVLAAKNWDGGIPTINFFDLLFAQSMGGGEQWETYEGALPATFNTTGDDMRQYQVYGATGGVGDRTTQLFNPNARNPENGYMANTFLYGTTYGSSDNWMVSEYIDISGLSRITLYRVNLAALNASVVFYTNNYEYISAVAYAERVTFSTPVPQNAQFCRVSIRKERWEMAAVVSGAIAPTTYIPFGYEVPIGVKSENICYKEITGVNIDGTATITTDAYYNVCVFECTQGETYTIKNADKLIVYAFFDSEPQNGSKSYNNLRVYVNEYTTSFTAPITGWCAVRYIAAHTPVMAVVGSEAPEKYQPYFNITMPIYIGDTALQKDEYIDYQAGKIYRRTGNLYDGTYMETGIFSQTGSVSPNADYRISQYMELGGNHLVVKIRTTENRYRSTYPAVWYDENKTRLKVAPLEWLVDAKEYIFEYPPVAGAKYVRIDYRYSDTDIEVFETWEEDPPVALPALPTAEGTTIIDYAGQSVAPEKVIFEYKKGGN